MGAFISVVICLAAVMMLIMSASFWSMYRGGKSPESSIRLSVHFGMCGALLLILQGLQNTRILSEYAVSIASAIVGVGSAAVGRVLRAKHKTPAK